MRWLHSHLLGILLITIVCVGIATGSQSPRGNAIPQTAAQSTVNDQSDMAVTVYNSNLALVRDVRQVTLPSGASMLKLEGVAASINPASVHVRSLSDPERLSVIEQRYEYDLLDPQKMLQRYVGREVTLVRYQMENGSTKAVETKALLLSDNNGPVWKIGNEIITGMQADSYRFADLPDNLYDRPTLIFSIENKGSLSQRIETSYLTGNFTWSADYQVSIGKDEKAADIVGWVTLANNSGAAYRNAKLQLVAGAIHRAAPQVRPEMAMARAMDAMAPQFGQEDLSEYHLYSLDRRTSIENNESKQIGLLSANVPIEKLLRVEGQPIYYRAPQSSTATSSQPVKIYYQFKNEQKGGLGIPLPTGTVRIYQADSKDGMQFLGEDTIPHTPKDETVSVNVGNAFDVTAERKQVDFKKIANNVTELEYQITLRNHKEEPVTVEVREPVGGDWEVLNSNYKWTKIDSATIGFAVPVDKSGSATLDYRVRVRY